MNVLVADRDEACAFELNFVGQQINPDFRVVKVVSKVAEAVQFLDSNPELDLFICNLDLKDGSGFEVFKESNTMVPVIFTNNDQVNAFQAFKFPSIDYLVKPIQKQDLDRSLKKYELLTKRPLSTKDSEPCYKKRFLVKLGEQYTFKTPDETAYFYADGGLVYLVEITSGRKFLVDYKLEELESTLLDPNLFFRINRSIIVQIDAILVVKKYVNSRLRIILKTEAEKDLIVGREKVNAFKDWLNG